MSNDCCFSKTLMLIDALQKSVEKDECFDNTCSRPYLGANIQTICFNTRPVTFYNCNNTMITANYNTTINGTTYTGTSGIFRVENVQGCCCVCSILISNPDTNDTLMPYVSTGQTTIINLKCVCALKCLPDTSITL